MSSSSSSKTRSALPRREVSSKHFTGSGTVLQLRHSSSFCLFSSTLACLTTPSVSWASPPPSLVLWRLHSALQCHWCSYREFWVGSASSRTLCSDRSFHSWFPQTSWERCLELSLSVAIWRTWPEHLLQTQSIPH